MHPSADARSSTDALISMGQSQAGDVAIGNVAGRDHISTTVNAAQAISGIAPSELVRILESFADEQHYRRDLESRARTIRQDMLDRELAEIQQTLKGQAQMMERQLFWLRVTIAVGGVLVFLVLLFALFQERAHAIGQDVVGALSPWWPHVYAWIYRRWR